MKEETKIHFGTFKTMNLNKKLLKNISFVKTTPIQRKTIPKILESQNITGIARTGSGKTLAYLVPIIQVLLTENDTVNGKNKKAVILLPTRELALQVYKIAKELIKSTGLKLILIQGGSSINSNFDKLNQDFDILIGTVGRLRHCLDEMNKKLNVNILCIDEMDRIFEEASIKADLDRLFEIIIFNQSIFFSATLPEKIIPLINNTEIVKIDNEMSATLTNYFFYVEYTEKEKALMVLLDRLKNKKIMIFTATRYSVEYLSEIMAIKHTKIYSSMDQQARLESLNKFINNKVDIIIVTDLAARGLDIKNLDCIIMYDLCNEKTYLHRAGRVARNGKKGDSYSLVSYEDIYLFYNIRDSYFADIEIGKIPQNLLDEKIICNSELKKMAENGSNKMKLFRKKITGVVNKDDITEYKIHSMFCDQTNEKHENLLLRVKNYRSNNITENSNLKIKENLNLKIKENLKDTGDKYKDQFYIPYKNKDNKNNLHSSAYSIPKDEKERKSEKERKKKKAGMLFKEWEKKRKIIKRK